MNHVQIQLVVPVTDDRPDIAVAQQWFHLAGEIFGDVFRSDASAEGSGRFPDWVPCGDNDKVKLDGAAGDLFTLVVVNRDGGEADYRSFAYSPRSWKGMLDAFVDLPHSVTFELGVFNEARHVGPPTLSCWYRTYRADGEAFALLDVTSGDQALIRTAEGQQRAVDFLLAAAQICTPSHGEIAFAGSGIDAALPSASGYGGMEAAITGSLSTLRSYSWVTVVGASLVPHVGGVDRLRQSGAFARVIPLDAGGVLLRATEDWNDFDIPAATSVFEVLAPILLGGMPMGLPSSNPIVLRDPRDIVRRQPGYIGSDRRAEPYWDSDAVGPEPASRAPDGAHDSAVQLTALQVADEYPGAVVAVNLVGNNRGFPDVVCYNCGHLATDGQANGIWIWKVMPVEERPEDIGLLQVQLRESIERMHSADKDGQEFDPLVATYLHHGAEDGVQPGVITPGPSLAPRFGTNVTYGYERVDVSSEEVRIGMDVGFRSYGDDLDANGIEWYSTHQEDNRYKRGSERYDTQERAGRFTTNSLDRTIEERGGMPGELGEPEPGTYWW